MNFLPRVFTVARRTASTRIVSFSVQSRFVHSTGSVAAEIDDGSNIVDASIAIEDEEDEYHATTALDRLAAMEGARLWRARTAKCQG